MPLLAPVASLTLRARDGATFPCDMVCFDRALARPAVQRGLNIPPRS